MTRRIQAPPALPQGRATHRANATRAISDWYTGGEARGDAGARLDFLTGLADRSPADLVNDLGSTRDVARLTGAAERTVRDWRAGRHAPNTAHRADLEKAARKATIESFGGVKEVARLTQRSESSVRAWARGTSAPGADAVHRLNKAEVRQRHQQSRQQIRQTVDKPLVMKLHGFVRVQPPGDPSYSYEYERDVWTELPTDVQDKIEDALARGEDELAHQAIERHLTTDYMNNDWTDDDYNGRDSGFFIDRIDSIDTFTDLPQF